MIHSTHVHDLFPSETRLVNVTTLTEKIDKVPSLDKLKLGKRLGRGGFCVVYEVWLDDRENGEHSKNDEGGTDATLEEEENLAQDAHPTSSSNSQTTNTNDCLKKTPQFVIKHLQPHIITSPILHKDGVADLAREACLLASMQHPNIIQIQAANFDPFLNEGGGGANSYDASFLILEHLFHGTLDARIREWHNHEQSMLSMFQWVVDHSAHTKRVRRLNKERHIILLQIINAMRYIHQRHIVYRDLKPSNIGFDLHYNVKLFDFGIARELPCDGTLATNTSNEHANQDDRDRVYDMSTEIGTHRYMAPEISNGKPYNQLADVYSFGIVLWEMMSLRTAFEGYNRRQFVYRVCKEGERPPTKQHRIHDVVSATSWPDDITMLMEQCWSANAKDRPTFQEIHDMMEKFVLKTEEDDMQKLVDAGDASDVGCLPM